MLSRETSDWSLKRRGDSLGEEQFGDFEEDKDLDEDFDDELDEDELEEEDLDDLDEYDDLDDEFDDEEDDEFRPKKGPLTFTSAAADPSSRSRGPAPAHGIFGIRARK